MHPHVVIGRPFGIAVGVHYTWVIIALLITLSLSVHFRDMQPQWSTPTIWLTAFLTGVLLFTAIVVHELAHALVVRARGIPVRSITLFALGGVANIERDAAEPQTEFWMGIAGPLASVAIGALCLMTAWSLGA